MDNPGAFALFNSSGSDFTVAAAATQTGIPLTGLDGAVGVSLQVAFAYGSGGTKTNVYIQTSLDQGNTWFDIANLAFTTSSGYQELNIASQATVNPFTPTNLTLADNTIVGGVLGDRLRALVVNTGTYGGQTLASVRGCAR